MVPVFEYVPVFGDSDAAEIRIVSLSGISTGPNPNTDRGRLYLKLATLAPYTLNVYKDAACTVLVASGAADALQTPLTLAAAGGSGITGQAWIEGASAVTTVPAVAVPTFAVDADVMADPDLCAAMPGYDPEYGLAVFHAAAVRQILASDLPVAVPHLFGGRGLAAFVPNFQPAGAIPDLGKLASIDQLRLAQASLVKALSAQQNEHMAEFAEIMDAAYARYNTVMTAVANANVAEKITGEAEDAAAGFNVGTWGRG